MERPIRVRCGPARRPTRPAPGGGRALALALLPLALGACVRPPDTVRADVQSVIDRSVPPRGRVIPGDRPRLDGMFLRASWRVEVEDMDWGAYAAWVPPQLGEFWLLSRGDGALRFSRPLAGDVYYVTLRRGESRGPLVVEARFEAQPF